LYLKNIKSGEGARSIFWGAESGARSHSQTGAKSDSLLYFLAASALFFQERVPTLLSNIKQCIFSIIITAYLYFLNDV
jgi:hypothetical protein